MMTPKAFWLSPLALLAVTSCTTMQPAQKTVAEIVGTNSDFSTLLAAVKAADPSVLAALSDKSKSLTVFAPTNAAFAKIPKADLDALLADKPKLTAVLLYHVVNAKVPAAEVVKLTKATTLNGKDVTIAVNSGTVTLNGTSTVTKTDVMASNGVIHVIDTVLLPPN